MPNSKVIAPLIAALDACAQSWPSAWMRSASASAAAWSSAPPPVPSVLLAEAVEQGVDRVDVEAVVGQVVKAARGRFLRRRYC